MICPVVTKAWKTRTVYISQDNWINYSTVEKLAGRQYLNLLCPLGQIPIFIIGALIATQKLVQALDAKTPQHLNLKVYPDTDTVFTIMMVKVWGYQNGNFKTTRFELEIDNDLIHLKHTETHNTFDLNERSYIYQIHLDQKPGKL